MKLKEKLAKKSGDKFWDKFQLNGEEFVMHPNVLYSLIYLEGFEKAREMAAEYNIKLWNESLAGYEIMKLGEEEV